jgi:phosphoglycerol transferase MdoB-like AlkP superfamily enzyme
MNQISPVVKRAALQFLLLLGIFSFCRAMFTVLNAGHFQDLALSQYVKLAVHGLRFDISVILMLNTAYFLLLLLPGKMLRYKWWRLVLNGLFIGVNSLALAFEFADWRYYPFTLKRATSDVLDMVGRKGDFLIQLPHFLVDFWYIFIGFALGLYAFIKLNRRMARRNAVTFASYTGKTMIAQVMAFLIAAGICLLGIRGGWQNQPLNIGFAVEAANGKYVPVVLNTPFSILTTVSNKRLPELRYYSDAELRQYVEPVKQYNAPSGRQNVVVIILESFSKQYTGLGKFQSYTPFLDSLMQHSFLCRNAYANALHSAEGIPAIIAGIPSLMEEPITSSVYSANTVSALPSLLKNIGYHTSFYHGATNGTMNFDVFCANAGFDEYNGRDEYPDKADYDGSWGIWDEPYLQYFAKELTHKKPPFFSSVFTLSSHDPFKVPKEYEAALPRGDLQILQSIAYTDMALRKFFETASKQPYYKNTLFIITADHCSLKTQDDNDHYNLGFYRIPILFYKPGDPQISGMTDSLMQQIDILPSVLDYIGYPKPFFAFGQSIFHSNKPRFLLTEHNNRYQLLMNGHILKTNNLETKELFNVAVDSNCSNNIIGTTEGSATRRQIEPYMRAMLQLYNTSLNGNSMSADKWMK